MAKSKSKGLGCCGTIALCFAALFVLAIVASMRVGQPPVQPTEPQSATVAPSPPTETVKSEIPYEVVDQKAIPNGGFTRVVLIDQKYRNETGLKKLAALLKTDTAKDRNAFVFIYDDRSAALNRNAALSERLSRSEIESHDAHLIGAYSRNANTGHHSFSIMLKGVNGPTKEIEQ